MARCDVQVLEICRTLQLSRQGRCTKEVFDRRKRHLMIQRRFGRSNRIDLFEQYHFDC